LEHIDDQGNYLFELYEEEIDILHVKIKSRFSRVTTHNIWLGYQKDYKLTEGQNPITDWYCDCKAGARIFGMCAHITSLIWYLGIGRHNPTALKTRRCDMFLKICKDTARDDEINLENDEK